MNEILRHQAQLQKQAADLLAQTPLLSLLKKLGNPIQTGSSVTGLMVYPDIDFAVQNDSYDINDAIALTPTLFDELHASALKIANFAENKGEDDRITILRLKSELIDTRRYVGARSQPPYTFRSAHLYEAVLKGDARSVAAVEHYFAPLSSPTR